MGQNLDENKLFRYQIYINSSLTIFKKKYIFIWHEQVSMYQSPYYLSVHDAFSALHILYKNVYIYSKEIRRLVIASNNAPVVK